MFGMSGEHLLVLGIILLFFGPRRLPELGNTLGKSIRNFKDAISMDPPRRDEQNARNQIPQQAQPVTPGGVVDVAAETITVKESTAAV
jgi:sec-independent protein translocase protein TatA